MIKCRKNASQQLSAIFFDFDKSTLREDQTETAKENLAILKDHPDLYIILGGHADERGTREYNWALSGRRAEAIQKYFTDNGIDPERIIIYAYGKDHLLKKNRDAVSRRINRRVDTLMWETVLTKEQFLDETIK